MFDTSDGGPAFPRPFSPPQPGMSLRDWFAGMALSGIAGTCLKGSGMVCDVGRAKTVALIAYAYADAMLKVRKE